MYVIIHVCIHGDTYLFPSQALCDVILESVIPTCAMYMLSDRNVRSNTEALSVLKSGEAHRQLSSKMLLAGSRAEGLTVDHNWGHPWPDADSMLLLGAKLGVTIPEHQAPCCQNGPASTATSSSTSSLPVPGDHSSSCLQYAPEGCPLAYTRLRITDLQTLLLRPPVDTNAVEEEDGYHWLNTRRLNERIQQLINESRPNPAHHTTSISGPAGQVVIWGNKNKSLFSECNWSCNFDVNKRT